MRLELTVELASVPDREEVVAEIWAGTHQFAEIRRDGNEFVVQVFPPAEEGGWDLSFEQLVNALTKAQARLAGA
jgi:hypothetical protein